MGLAICLARLVEVELGPGPKAVVTAAPAPVASAQAATPASPASPPPIAPVPVTAAAAPQAIVEPIVRTVVIKKGDTLGSISTKVYGTSKLWKKIYSANRGVLPAPNRLKVGKTLVIPPR
jgi:nucleoid-associated protein YgaU